MTIPKRLVRTVPETSSVESEIFWKMACDLHPDWEYETWRDPVDRSQFPLYSRYWDKCKTGAQLADLIRAEDLFIRGGVYIDSDYEVFKPFDPFLALDGFAGWEDPTTICNAVMGFKSGHLGLAHYLGGAAIEIEGGADTWTSGVGLFTKVFRTRRDVLLLPPDALYPVHYKHKNLVDLYKEVFDYPYAFGVHHWAHSWG